jgi:Phosphotransferase enzyme family
MPPYLQPTDPSALLGVRLLTANKEEAGRIYTAYPNLPNVRWLLPANQPALRRAAIGGLYQPNTLRGRALRTVIGAGAVRGEKVWLEDEALASLETKLASLLRVEAVRLAFYLGVPAPHRKVTAQVLSPQANTLAYAKIATSELAKEALETERRALLRLSDRAQLQGTVPKVLGSLQWQGAAIVLITMGPARPGPRGLSSVHLRFCTQLFNSFRVHKTFEESQMWSGISKTWLRLKHSSPQSLPANLGPALDRLHEQLGPVSMPLSLAHGDFAPWNTRLGERSLFVLDWERASEGMSPLYDAFNFQALQEALQGRRRAIADRRFLERLLDAQWPEGGKHLPDLYLAYLSHVSLLYSEAQSLQPGVGERKVWGWFGKQIESALKEDATS